MLCYRVVVCHELIFTKRDDDFWVNFDHFQSKQHFWVSQIWANNHLFLVPIGNFIASIAIQQRPPVNNNQFIWVSGVVVINKFECTSANWSKPENQTFWLSHSHRMHAFFTIYVTDLYKLTLLTILFWF